MPNRDTYTSGGAYTNFASAVEMALYDGKMKKYGDVQLGIQTGDARKFKSWDEFWNAYVQQHMLLLRTTFIQQYIVIQTRAKHFCPAHGLRAARSLPQALHRPASAPDPRRPELRLL